MGERSVLSAISVLNVITREYLSVRIFFTSRLFNDVGQSGTKRGPLCNLCLLNVIARAEFAKISVKTVIMSNRISS